MKLGVIELKKTKKVFTIIIICSILMMTTSLSVIAAAGFNCQWKVAAGGALRTGYILAGSAEKCYSKIYMTGEATQVYDGYSQRISSYGSGYNTQSYKIYTLGMAYWGIPYATGTLYGNSYPSAWAYGSKFEK